jgi:hypothetical protein
MFAIEQEAMLVFNVGDSAYCDMELGKLRRWAGLFRECLVHGHDDSESEGERKGQDGQGGHLRVGYDNLSQSGDLGQGQEQGEVHLLDEGSGEESLSSEESLGAAGYHQRQNQHSHGNNPYAARKVHTFPGRMHVPDIVRGPFMADFRDFFRNLCTHVREVTPLTAGQVNSWAYTRANEEAIRIAVQADPFARAGLERAGATATATAATAIAATGIPPMRGTAGAEGAIQWEKTCRAMGGAAATVAKVATAALHFIHPFAPRSAQLLYSDMVLAATLATIFGYWKAPLRPWDGRDVALGCAVFRRRCADLDYEDLCALLEMRVFVDSGVMVCKRLERSLALPAWAVLKRHDFYQNPARNILSRWVLEVVKLMSRLSVQGGRAGADYSNCDVAHVQHVRWGPDVLDGGNGGRQLLGEILTACMQKCLIYEDRNCMVRYYYDRGGLDNLQAQCIGCFDSPQLVRVYHSDEDTFVSVSVSSDRLLKGHSVPDWTYFSRTRVRDLISMLQPSFTEILEGKVQKYDIKEGGQHKWYQLLAQWASLDNTSIEFGVNLLRSRFMVLSRLGHMHGYLVRMEMFEERFGEVRILVYGLNRDKDKGGDAVGYLADRGRVFELLPHCDPNAEKDKLDQLDTQGVAYIFSDRLEVRYHPPICFSLV